MPRLTTRAKVSAVSAAVDPRLQDLLDRQRGLVSRRQLLRLGWTSGRVATQVGRWRVVLPGVYLLDDRALDLHVRAHAALLARPDACLSHLTAARLREWEVLDARPAWVAADEWPSPDQIDLTCRSTAARPLPGVVLHRDPRVAPVLVRGMRVTDSARTLVDVATSTPLPVAVCLLDARFRQEPGLRQEVQSMLDRRMGARGIVAAHRAMRLVNEKSESLLESLLRLLIVLAGLPAPTPQLAIRLGRMTYRADFGYEHARLILEADGRDYHSEWQDVARDMTRQNALVAAGWRVLRFTWAQVLFQPELVIAAIRAALHENDH